MVPEDSSSIPSVFAKAYCDSEIERVSCYSTYIRIRIKHTILPIRLRDESGCCGACAWVHETTTLLCWERLN